MHRHAIFRRITAVAAAACALTARAGAEEVPLAPPLFAEWGVTREAAPGVADSVLSFEEILRLALARNPAAASARARVAAAEGRLRQSGFRRNPELTFDVEEFGRKDGSGPAQSTLGLEQPLELFDRRGARTALAAAELTAEIHAAQETLLELYGEASAGFAAALGTEESVALARRRRDITDKILSAVKVKVADGAVPRSELLRAEAALRLAEIEVVTAEAAAAEERIALATLWGSSGGSFRLDGSLEQWLADPGAPAERWSVADNPRLLRLAAEVKAREAELRLARAAGRPDLALGAGYRRLHDESRGAFIAWTAVPLPLFDRNRGGIRESEARREQAEAELGAATLRLEGELRRRILTLEARQRQATLLRDQVIPLARQALDETDLAYRLGSRPYLEVLDAHRTLAELEGQLLEARVAGARAGAEIERITGHRLTAPGR